MDRSKIIFFIIALTILFNFHYQAIYVCHHVRNFNHPSSLPGQYIADLRPYLKNVAWAGYFGDDRSATAFSDPKCMLFYQQAQFALSPTLLDYYHPLNYEFVIFNCADQKLVQRTITEIHGRVIAVSKAGVILVRRSK